MSGLQALGLTVGDVELGGLDAESDDRLWDDFVRTPYLDMALSGRAHLLLGQKGSGKSALFRLLPTVAEREGHKAVVPLTPDAYEWAALREYAEAGITSEQAHANAWKLTIALEVAITCLRLDRLWSDAAIRPLGVIKDFIEANFGSVPTRGLASARRVKRGVETFNVQALGFAVGGSLAPSGSAHALTTQVLESLYANLEPILAEQPLLVEFDRLDDAWDGSEGARSCLIGLLKAVKDVNDRHRSYGGVVALRAVAFLRTDIYLGLSFDDKDKHRAFEARISWTPAALRELVSVRLPEGLTVDDLFFGDSLAAEGSHFDWLLARTFLRPREVLQFVQLCLSEAGMEAQGVTSQQLEQAASTFSWWKFEDLKQEYVKSSPTFPDLLGALHGGAARYASLAAVVEVLKAQLDISKADLAWRRDLELLYSASVLGAVRQDGRVLYASANPEASLPAQAPLEIHEALRLPLDVRP